MNIKTLNILGIAAIFAACNSNPNTKTADSIAADSAASDTSAQTAAAPGHVCFLRTEGTQNQDSTKIHLMIAGDKVTGDMQWLPKEKDARKGTLEGTQDGNTIKAIWTFNQEGTKDTMAVEFNFPGDKLTQKPYKVNAKDGRQQTDTKAGYTVVYEKVDCD
ncbi:hypothetical protein LJ707_03600 [Mucilaginibacter sp. UR6-1]|uniref:hypothetical protein n=1 Tax=Mucilaginibacter sp. UR6-1 TaxID=1435643 RepID=UPI001E30E5D0|nr:hypothetical protein [Mucilaginibacter sp. UR6-1]MCC8407999.1 hypothetical protein [Mucilaginibacter sp. UR6-1]